MTEVVKNELEEQERKKKLWFNWKLKLWRRQTYPYLQAVEESMHYLSVYNKPALVKEKDND
jgi:activator of HSP90 ATPase